MHDSAGTRDGVYAGHGKQKVNKKGGNWFNDLNNELAGVCQMPIRKEYSGPLL